LIFSDFVVISGILIFIEKALAYKNKKGSTVSVEPFYNPVCWYSPAHVE
jgi:hypothetical protein